MSEQFNSHYFSGQGPVFIGTRDASGNPAGLTFIGDVSAVEFPANISRTDVLENVTGNRNIGASFRTQTEYALRIVMKSVKPDHLARAVGGAVTTKTAASVTDEDVIAHHDKFSKLAHVKVSTVVVQDATDTTTYVADTDYVLHADEGMIEVLSTGSIGDGDTLHVDYDYAAQKHVAANPVDEDLVLVCPTINRARDSKRGRLTLHKINLDPGSLNAIEDGDQESSMELTGKVLLDDLQPAGDRLFRWEMED